MATLSKRCITVPKQGQWQSMVSRLGQRCTVVPLWVQGINKVRLEVHKQCKAVAR